MTLVIKLHLTDEQKEILVNLDRNTFARDLIHKSGINNEKYTHCGWSRITDLNFLFLD